MADDEIDGCTDNDAELEIQSQATSTFDDATHREVGRRTSLDRSYTMPAPSWEEGDQILKEYRLRKAAREAARMNRSSEGGVWSTPRRTASGSAPPSVIHDSDAGRSPSRNTVSSTISLRKQAVPHDSNIAPLVEEDDFATIPPRPSSSSGSFTSSQIFRLPPLTRPSSLRNASAAVSENAPHRDTLDDTSPTTSRRVSTASKTKRRPSSVRATSDGPLASRRSSSRLPPEDVQTMHSRSGSQIKGTRVPSTHTTSATDETETSSSRPSSIIDHGEVIESDTPSAASLADELRGHSIPVYDYTAYGIPKTVILGGKQVDISDMGILEQVEMLRRAQQEARDSKNRTSSGDTLAGKPLEPLDFYQNMPSTDLSVIAERTECSTVSRRTTIAPTDGTESARSYSVPAFGRHLAPTHTRSRLSLSTTKSSLSSDSISPSEGGKDMTEAERIRHRFMRKTANKADVEQPTAPQSGKATPAYTPGHRKYTSVGDTKYHTLPLSPTSSASVSLHNSASSIAVPALAKPATKTASSARLAASGLKPLNNSQKLSLGFPDPLKTASSGESPYMTSKGTSSAASGRPSPSKHAFSPTIAQKIEALRKAPSLAQEDYNTSPISRKRSKSLHSDDRSSRSRIFGDSSDGAAMPPLPKALGLPPSKSTSALVQMFESKASAVPVPEANRTSFPVKEWLKKVDLQKVPPSPGIYPPTPPSISSASGSVVDYNAYKRRRDKEDAANAAGLSASTGRAQQRRRRSQSLTALPEVVVSREAQPPLLPSSTTVSSFEDSAVVYHGNLYWLDSSSTARPPFWQACRAVITTQEELRISWLGPRSGGMHERFFDLRSCTAAHSIRRPPHITTTSVQAYDPESLPPTQDELSRLQVFELVWPGRTQRFACPSLATRIKWLSHIFEVIVRYSNTSTPLSEQEAAPVEERSLGSVTLRSMDLPRPSLTSRPSDSASEVSNLEKVPIRQLAKETQDSLYASVSEMLSGASASRKASDLPDIPRYQLKDVPSRDVEESRTPHTPMSVTPRPSRGAWSDADRVSTQSDPVSGAPPAARSVARDLKRILTLMSKTRSTSASSDIGNGFPDQMKEMQSHLERLSQDIRHTSVAARHSRHAPEMVSKMDELLALCKRMAEEKPKAPLYAQEVSEAKSGELELIADAVKKAEPEERQAGLVRLEEKMETLLEVVNRLAAAESPTAQKRSKSPDQSPELPKTTSYITSASNPSAAPIPAVHPAHYATAQALQLLPSTPSLMGELGMDFDQDLEQWQKYDKKRNSALPPLPPFGGPNVKQKSRGDAVANLQSASERAAMTDFYKNLGRKAEPSSRPSSIVSSNRVRNARSDAAMRLEGSHPGLLATQSQSTRTIDKRQPISKWSADTPLLDPASRRPSAKANVNVASRPKKIQQVAVQAVLESDDGDTSPPTPKQRGFPKQDAIKSETALPSVTVVDNKTQEAILIQLNSMQGLLETLVAAQNKQSEALKHQEDVSVYIKHLQEYLAEDRVHRKEEFAAIKASLTSISQQLSGLPKEIQTLVEASLAVAVLQKPTAADAASTVEPTPAPAPDTDSPNTDVAVVAAKQVPQVESGQPIKTAAEAPQSQGKKSGTSLFRKVSLGLAGMASVGAGNAGGRVGGPRKMGAGRLFGNPQPGGTAPDARDRWNPNRYKPVNGTTGDLPQADVPEQDPTVSQVVDPQAPLMAALAGFEKQISDESGDNEDGATIIALGILEVLKMLKEQEAREHEREHYRREEALLRSDEERERHAAELDAVRAELREWEAKREELAAAQIKDETSEGIDTIIALLKDQMAHQEEALVNLKDTLSPQIRDIGAESEEAILAMREEMSKSLADFKTQLDEEVKKTLDEVGVLRDQKKQLQSDLSDLLAFKSKYGGGAPETLQKPQPSMAPQHTSQRMPIHPIRPTARQAYPQAYPPPRPDTSMSAGGQQYHWGLKGPR